MERRRLGSSTWREQRLLTIPLRGIKDVIVGHQDIMTTHVPITLHFTLGCTNSILHSLDQGKIQVHRALS